MSGYRLGVASFLHYAADCLVVTEYPADAGFLFVFIQNPDVDDHRNPKDMCDKGAKR